MYKLLFVTLFFTCKMFGQTNILIKAELTNRIAIDDYPHMAFLIAVTNNDSVAIQIPDSSTLLLSKETYSAHEVGYILNKGASYKKLGCEGLIARALDIPYQTVLPGETKFISAFYPKDCLRKNKKYKITFYLKILKQGNPRKKENYVEGSSNTIQFDNK
jgi:hypothetical protein